MSDAIVLGAGPAGLAAALSLASRGAEVTLIDGAEHVGGLCTTRRRQGLAYDIGGHMLFVRNEARKAWLEALIGDDLLWVNRPAACVLNGHVRPGRYLDQASASPVSATAVRDGGQYLEASIGAAARDEFVRGYLEKVDGMALESISAGRVEKLLIGQSAPDGFWYPRHGIGQLMDAMAAAFVARGGTLRLGELANRIAAEMTEVAVSVGGATLRASRLICAIPGAQGASLANGPIDRSYQPAMRAVAIVYLLVDRDPLTDEVWIQVDDPDVPFARVAIVNNWSPALIPSGFTLLACEVYCRASPDDRWWPISDEALADVCMAALVGPLALVAGTPRCVEVIRLPHAYPSIAVEDVPRVMTVSRWLGAQPNVTLAQGGAVIEAIDAGEAATS